MNRINAAWVAAFESYLTYVWILFRNTLLGNEVRRITFCTSRTLYIDDLHAYHQLRKFYMYHALLLTLIPIIHFSQTKKFAYILVRFFLYRWLQIVPVVERVLLLFDALLEFFTTNTSAGARFERIRSILRHPLTKFKLHLLLEVLKPLRSFELLFQKVIHLLLE